MGQTDEAHAGVGEERAAGNAGATRLAGVDMIVSPFPIGGLATLRRLPQVLRGCQEMTAVAPLASLYRWGRSKSASGSESAAKNAVRYRKRP